MIYNPNDRTKRRRVKLVSGEVRELSWNDSLPEGAEILSVSVPLLLKDSAAMQDAALREFARFPFTSDFSEEEKARRERDRLLGEREGAYLAMKADIAQGYMSEEQRAATPEDSKPHSRRSAGRTISGNTP